MGKLKIVKQFIYNAVATALPTIILQLAVLPLIATKMSGDDYGLALTMIAAVTMVAAAIGNVLNNVHMLSNSEYEQRNETGDFGILVTVSLILTAAVSVIFSLYYGSLGIKQYILNLVFSLVLLIKEYYIVKFWIDLDYCGILKCNMWCVAGYIVGTVICYFGGDWQYIYILGNIFSIGYIYSIYGVPRSFFAKTTLFAEVVRKSLVLSVATILARSLQYADRMLLYPMLGGENVTVYYIATLIGKTISMALTPVNGFLLSQLAKKDSMSKNTFAKILAVTMAISIIGYVTCVILAKPVIGMLYPQWIETSMPYIRITTVTAMVSAASVVISPIVLRFCSMNWQIVLQGTCFVVYVVSSLLLLKYFGLMGFCFGGLIANTVLLMLMIIIYFLTYKEKKGNKECAE